MITDNVGKWAKNARSGEVQERVYKRQMEGLVDPVEVQVAHWAGGFAS